MVLAVALSVPASLITSAALAAPAYDRTGTREAQRVDRVPTPKLAWADCSTLASGAQCASVQLPLDYDQPKGAKTSVAMLRIKATDQQHKIGTVFVNPGGPGASGVVLAGVAAKVFSAEALAKFDVVGFDPRGTNYSDNVRCWRTDDERNTVLAAADIQFPWTAAEKAANVKSAEAFGRACSTTGRPLTAHMSTAEVARDMDVLRRAVGDRQLTFLGFSYGTYLGQVYANMFPDRVRAIAIDGVLDPIGWAGTPATRNIPQTARVRSGEGAAKALHEILVRCGKAGAKVCPFAANGDPVATHATIIAKLKKAPLTFTDKDGTHRKTSYADLVGMELGRLFTPSAPTGISELLSEIHTLLQPPAPAGSAAANRQAEARTRLSKILATRKTAADVVRKRTKAFPLGFPYKNGSEAFQTVLCTDGLNPRDAGAWPAYADAQEKAAADFGPLWTWSSAPCASKTWTVQDEDSYTGPFTRRTINPVLVAGNYWDPATNYDNAVKAASLLPNSRLLSSDGWGHAASTGSACAKTAIERYLLTKSLPAEGTVCAGDLPPFSTSPAAIAAQEAAANDPLPIVPILPGTPRW